MDTRKIIEEQVELLSSLSYEIAEGRGEHWCNDPYPLLPEIGKAIAALLAVANQ